VTNQNRAKAFGIGAAFGLGFILGPAISSAAYFFRASFFGVRWNCSGGSLITIFLPTLKQKLILTQYFFDLGLGI